MIVTFLTDFGTVDGYVAAMKGVVLSRAPNALVVDISHDIPPQDVAAGAWALREAAPWYPPGSIHLAVVDPGVGGDRRPLLLRFERQLFVGPDNGLLSLAVDPSRAETWTLDRADLYLTTQVSNTFHGRDIFAAVVGRLAAGLPPESCGTPTGPPIGLSLPDAREEGDRIEAMVIHVDRFGNLVTNVRRDQLGAMVNCKVSVSGRADDVRHAARPIEVRKTFASVSEGQWVSYVGSAGLLEIAIRQGNASLSAGVGRGAPVVVERPTEHEAKDKD